MASKQNLFLDYIDDLVGNKSLNASVLIAILGPLFYCLFFIQTRIDPLNPPIFYMLGWFFLPSIICLIILIPLQMGNNNYTNSHSMFISIIWCLLLLAYETYVCYLMLTSMAIPWFYFVALFASIIASIFATFTYLYILLTQASYRAHAEERLDIFDDSILPDIDSDHEDVTSLQLEVHSFIALFRQILWPPIPYMKGNFSIIYPSRVSVTVFLSLAGVVGCNELLTYIYIMSGEQLHTLSAYIAHLEHMDFSTYSGNDTTANEAIAVHDWCLSVSNWIYSLAKPICDALLISTQVGLFFGIFGAMMLFRVWKQRMVYTRYSYGINGKKWSEADLKDYPLWWSAKFMASVSCSIVFGSVMISILCSVVFGFITSGYARSLLIDDGAWKYIVCYACYYVFEVLIFQVLLMKIYCKNSMDHKFASVIMIINDLTYIPLAVLFCFVKIVQWMLLCVFSFIRPDLSLFPGYLATLDHGHMSFVSSVRLAVEKEKRYGPQSIHLIDSDDQSLNAEIAKINADINKYAA